MGVVISIVDRLPSELEFKLNVARGIRLRQEARVARRKELSRTHTALRHSAKMKRTPPWADLNAIKEIYKKAARMTLDTGIKYHVDHIIPLQGEFVSGLHVHTNMQIITAEENIKKYNKFDGRCLDIEIPKL